MSNAMKGIGFINEISNMLSHHSVITMCKSFVRPHLDCGDILYDQPNNESLCQKIKSILYNAASAIRGVIRDTSQMNLYNELGFENCACFTRSKKLVYLKICSK